MFSSFKSSRSKSPSEGERISELGLVPQEHDVGHAMDAVALPPLLIDRGSHQGALRGRHPVEEGTHGQREGRLDDGIVAYEPGDVVADRFATETNLLAKRRLQ